MRFILSRKGFDSSWGGHPCPILPDGGMVMLPIPVAPDGPFADADRLTYEQLHVPGHPDRSYAELMHCHRMNGLRMGKHSRPLDAAIRCHLDPDLIRNVAERAGPWRAAFGQSDAAESHLRNQDVGEHDLFLFFGLFRRSDGNSFLEGTPTQHVLFGYLQVGETYRTDLDVEGRRPEWSHPHFESGYVRTDQTWRKNGIYAASEELIIARRRLGRPGYGVFRYNDALVLTKPNATSHTQWNLPELFRTLALSYHGGASHGWQNTYFQSAYPGQEFVFEASEAAVNWFEQRLLPHRSLDDAC